MSDADALRALRERAHSGHWNDDDMLGMIAELQARLAQVETDANAWQHLLNCEREQHAERLAQVERLLEGEREHHRRTQVALGETQAQLAKAQAALPLDKTHERGSIMVNSADHMSTSYIAGCLRCREPWPCAFVRVAKYWRS